MVTESYDRPSRLCPKTGLRGCYLPCLVEHCVLALHAPGAYGKWRHMRLKRPKVFG